MYCPNCGLEIQNNIKFCPNCGTPIAPLSAEQQPNPIPEPEPEPEPIPEPVSQPAPQPVENGIEPNSMEKTLALEAYLGLLVLAPLFGAKKSTFVRFHTNQGIVLCALSIALSLLISFNSIIMASVYSTAISVILGLFNGLYGLVYCGIIALSIIGIINALKGKMKALPIIGKIKILK
jgi:uncharacterized membrane protein